jgi:hypothetical protein
MHDWLSICTCLRYESSMVGSYVSTKWFRHSCHGLASVYSTGAAGRTWIVRAVLPTPPSPSTTSLYSVIFPAMVSEGVQELCGGGECEGSGPDRGTGGS